MQIVLYKPKALPSFPPLPVKFEIYCISGLGSQKQLLIVQFLRKGSNIRSLGECADPPHFQPLLVPFGPALPCVDSRGSVMSAFIPHTILFLSYFNLANTWILTLCPTKNNLAFDNTFCSHQFPSPHPKKDHTSDWRQKCDLS